MNQKAITVKSTFKRKTSVSIDIAASPENIWELLTTAENYPHWNSTVVMLEGKIAEGETIRLKSILDEKRVFKLKVKKMDSPHCMVWGDGQGERVYTLTDLGSGTCQFSMEEEIGGLMFPLYARFIPEFDAVFDQFALDLKTVAEQS